MAKAPEYPISDFFDGRGAAFRRPSVPVWEPAPLPWSVRHPHLATVVFALVLGAVSFAIAWLS